MSNTTTHRGPGTVGSRPGTIVYRTRADRAGDVVSLAILAALACFAVAVSFTHTMDFVRAHGQNRGWVVVGTACTVVLLTLQSAMEVWRDSRARRPKGWPVVIFGVGVVVELSANASTAHGMVNSFVAAWPVPVAATAVWLCTRRLQHAAEAAEQLHASQVPAEAKRRPAQGSVSVSAPLDPDVDQAVDLDVDQDDDQAVDLDGLTVKDRVFAVLRVTPAEEWPQPGDLAAQLGSDRRYVWRLMKEYDAAQTGGQVPGQLELAEAAA